MKIGEEALLWATLKALENLVGRAMDANKELFIEDFGEEGVERVAARLPDGTAVAHVTRAGGDKKRPVVLDEAALLAWAEENAPGYVIVEPEKVVPARRTVTPALLDALTIVDTDAILASTGEAVPGVGVNRSRPYLSVRFVPGGDKAIIAAIADGALQDVYPLMLEETDCSGDKGGWR